MVTTVVRKTVILLDAEECGNQQLASHQPDAPAVMYVGEAVQHHQRHRKQDEEDQTKVEGPAGTGVRLKDDPIDLFTPLVHARSSLWQICSGWKQLSWLGVYVKLFGFFGRAALTFPLKSPPDVDSGERAVTLLHAPASIPFEGRRRPQLGCELQAGSISGDLSRWQVHGRLAPWRTGPLSSPAPWV